MLLELLLLLLMLPPPFCALANVVGTLTKKLMLLFRFFIEWNNDLGVVVDVDVSCVGVGGGAVPITEMPELRPMEPIWGDANVIGP